MFLKFLSAAGILVFIIQWLA